MKQIGKTFTVEITEREAVLLSNFLDNEVKEWSKLMQEERLGDNYSEATYFTLKDCKNLRNGFAELIGKHYTD